MSDLCLTLLCPLTLEEQLLDMLLINPSVFLFTSAPTAAHGASVGQLSPSEQVLGRALVTQMQVLFASADKETLLSSIQQQFGGTGLRYWVAPIHEQGEFA